MTQRETVLRMLERGACGTDFLRRYIPRFGGRIHELRQAGYVVERSQCRNKRHRHESAQWLYRLAK